MTVVVEVFYTESVNISSLIRQDHGFLSTNGLMGRGESKPAGIPKNEDCKMCNLSFTTLFGVTVNKSIKVKYL